MYKSKKVAVVMPAYNAAKTLLATYNEILEQDLVDIIIIVDDASTDNTVEISKTLNGVYIFQHQFNKGYGANQKTCYKIALDSDADIVVMVHPDYQYTPRLIPAMVSVIANGLYHCVIGSRILGGYALKGGMPFWKYIANRFLTFIQNILMGSKLSEYHSGYRAFSRELLESLPFNEYSDDFLFDNQMLAHIIWKGFTICEITCPTKYFPEASSINFLKSIKYGLGCLLTAFSYRFARMGLIRSKIFK